ncbi:MAG: hypothetical protein US15_C0012G0017 [Candidatus Moranbacteria bacterium GW2011_GWF1_36_4]|nr:MAG: hypothetical protein US15_C0012G0017 [Candidatus Moranbacteria bacterium GW2011_GWF1_36_4]
MACSAAITPNSGGTETLNSGAFASGSITVGNTYYLGIITNDHWGDAGWGPSFTQGATYTDVVNTTGSYASPPSTINPATDASNTKGNIVVWVTN